MAFYEITTQPTIEPVTLAEAKAHAIIDVSLGTDDDNFLTMLIVAARLHVENITSKALITRTITMTLDAWPGGGDGWWSGVRQGSINNVHGGAFVNIERGPFQSVQSVNVLDEDGVPTPWASSNWYATKILGNYGTLNAKGGASFPSTGTRAGGAIQIEFKAGYGDAATDAPQDLRNAIMMLVAHWYEHREAVATDEDARPAISAGVPHGFKAITDTYRELRLN